MNAIKKDAAISGAEIAGSNRLNDFNCSSPAEVFLQVILKKNDINILKMLYN